MEIGGWLPVGWVALAVEWPVRPQHLPQPQDLRVIEFAFEEDEQPAEAEEEIAGIARFQVGRQVRIYRLHQTPQLAQLQFNTRLIQLEIQTLPKFKISKFQKIQNSNFKIQNFQNSDFKIQKFKIFKIFKK